MTLFFIISFGLILAYVFLLLHITKGWEATTAPLDNAFPDDAPKATVIIPVRDEEENIGQCLQSIIDNDIPKKYYDIIVVDDHSTDETFSIVAGNFPDVRLIKLVQAHGKKSAIDHGVNNSNADLCLVTDADCMVGPGWIKSHINTHISDKSVFQTGPVICEYIPGVLGAFQFLDFAALSQVVANGIQRGTYYIANGANMAFSREAYLEAGGMSSHLHIASGDDMFLVDAMSRKFPGRIAYLKDPKAVTVTKSENTWHDFWRQRRRWASKVKSLPKTKGYFIQALIFVIHILIILHFVLIPWSGGLTLFTGIFLLFIKAIIDYLFLGISCNFFNERKPLKYFFQVFIMYFPYIIFMAYHGIAGSKYEWKGRKGM